MRTLLLALIIISFSIVGCSSQDFHIEPGDILEIEVSE